MTTMEAASRQYQQRVTQCLTVFLADACACGPLQDAMRYAVLQGGKRLRPLLVYTLGETLSVPVEKLDHAACAVELVHAYSLVHDDLPMMDNDDWRRGRPSCHQQFGESMALLAGDALQALAFEVLTQAPLDSLQTLTLLKVLVKAVGPSGMVGGQAMECSKLAMPLDLVVQESMQETIDGLKTGSLFRVALEFAGIIGNAPSEILSALGRLGYALGQSYQLQDDIVDQQVELQNFTAKKASVQRRLLASFEDLQTVLPLLPKQCLRGLFPQLFLEPSIESVVP